MYTNLYKVLKWLSLTVLSLLLLFICIFLSANWHDGPRHPKQEKWTTLVFPTPEEMASNRFFVINGLNAAQEQDAHSVGIEKHEEQKKRYLHWKNGGAASYSHFKPSHIEPIFAKKLQCGAEQRNCFTHYQKNTTSIQKKIKEKQYIIDRYLSLKEGNYVELVIPYIHFEFPPYHHLIQASELVNMQAVLYYNAGKKRAAYNLWIANARIHQKIQNGSGSLISGMIVLAMQYKQLRLMSAVIASDTFDSGSEYEPMQSVLQISQPDPSHMIHGEMRYALHQHDHIPRYFLESIHAPKIITSTLEKYLYLPNETFHLGYETWSETSYLSTLPANELDIHLEKIRHIQEKRYSSDADFPIYFRNPVGKYLLLLAQPHASMVANYIYRTHDIEAYRRMVALQLQIPKHKVSKANIQIWLESTNNDFRNPYTLEPIQWNASDEILFFEGRQPQNQNPDRSSIYRVHIGSILRRE